MERWTVALIGLGLVCASARAVDLTGQDAPAALPAAPGSATAESTEAESLVKKLGDNDFRVRNESARRLYALGKPALGALKRAVASEDPEVQIRAQQLVRSLEQRPVPGRPRWRNGVAPGDTPMRLSIRNGEKHIEVNDSGRRIEVIEGSNGIRMSVTGEVDGEQVTEEYSASSADDLRAENPEAFALYDQWAAGLGDLAGLDPANGVEIQINPLARGRILRGREQLLRLRGGAPMLLPLAGIRAAAGGDDLEALRGQIDKQMSDARLTPEQQRAVRQALNKVADARNEGFDAPPEAAPGRMERYNDASDALRKALADLRLRDPGDALPPAANSRLGISTPADGDAEDGIVVGQVLPRSRGQKLGIHPGDIIQKINGKPVSDVKELRRLVSTHPKGLIIEGQRNGEPLKLEEKDSK